TVCRAGDVAPRLLAGVAVQLFGADRDGAPGDLDLHGVGVRGQVVVPGGVLGGPVRGRDDQPAVGAVGEVGDRGVAWGAALGADGGQDQCLHAHHLLGVAADPVHVPGVHPGRSCPDL